MAFARSVQAVVNGNGAEAIQTHGTDAISTLGAMPSGWNALLGAGVFGAQPTLKKHSMSSEAEIAWAAGLFEGEGTWGVYTRLSYGKPRKHVLAALGMTDQDVVDHFARIMGCGKVTVRSKQRGNRKTVYVWQISEAAAIRSLVELFRPWLGARRMARGDEILRLAAGIQVHSRLRTHCPKGHPLSGPNLMPYYHPERPERMVRKCRACTNASSREWQRKRLGITPDRYRVV